MTASMSLPVVIEALDLFGTAVFAMTGALRAMSKRLDLMGAVVLAVVTAMGGGMMRDALIGRHPPAAFADQSYLIIAIAVGIIFIAMLTATGGGVLRAMLVNEIPFILKKEIYASASLLGAVTYLLLQELDIVSNVLIWSVIIVTTGARLLSWRWNIHLPQA